MNLAAYFVGGLEESAHPEWINTSTQYTATYVYDAGGLLTSQTDPRSKVAEYTYDDIGRPLTITYSDSTPDVAYTYDQNDFAGFLTTVDVDGVTASAFEYDDAGQLIEETVTFDGVSGSFTTSYEYDLGGRLVEITYPSGRVVTRTYDAGGGIASGRLAGLTNGPTSTALVGSIQDNAAGQIISRTLGSSIQETRSFNNRFQLTGIGTTVSSTTLLDLAYGYGTTTNTGRILSRTDGVQPEHSVGYTYDAIGRLTEVEAASPAWSVSWELDRWGNRTSQTPSGLASGRVGSQSIYYGNDNKNDAWTYDNAGNVTSDTSHNYTWDAESRLIQMDSSSNVYAYDAEGRRIKRTAGSVTTYYLYGLTGLLSEFSDSTALSSATAAASTDRLEYRVGDATGTAVLLMDGSGNVRANNRVFPFGEAWWYPLGSGTTEQFTTYQRDSALDYAMARYYRFSSGRFMSTDPGQAGASLEDPQSWNGYAYVGNDPINSIDPDGLCEVRIGGSIGSVSIGVSLSGIGPECFGRSSGLSRIRIPGVHLPGVPEYPELPPGYNPDAAPIWSPPSSAPDWAGTPPYVNGVINSYVMPDGNKTRAGELTRKLGRCARDQFGITDLFALGAIAAGQPISGTKPFIIAGSSRGTSLAGLSANRVFGGATFPTRVPTIVGGPGTGRALAVAGTKSVGRFAGRAVPIAGWAMLGYDVVRIGGCVGADSSDGGSSGGGGANGIW